MPITSPPPADLAPLWAALQGIHRPSRTQQWIVTGIASMPISVGVFLLGGHAWWSSPWDLRLILFGVAGLLFGIGWFLIYNVRGQYIFFHPDYVHIHLNRWETYRIAYDQIALVSTTIQRGVGLYSLKTLTLFSTTGRPYHFPLTPSLRAAITRWSDGGSPRAPVDS